MGGPAAGVGVFTEQKSGAWQHPELQAGAEEHGQLVLRPAARIPHVGAAQTQWPLIPLEADTPLFVTCSGMCRL